MSGAGRATAATGPLTPREAAEEALLDAAERLLVSVGYAAVTTRRLAEEAGVNHGLVHYYFGSMDNLLVRTLERFTERLIARQRANVRGRGSVRREVARGDALPRRGLLERLPEGLVRAPGICLESSGSEGASSAGHARVVRRPARGVRAARREHDVDIPLDVLVTLVATFNQGIILEKLSGIDEGHRQLLDWIDEWLEKTG